jgi:hypothetical protein
MTRDEMLTALRQLEEEFYDDANCAVEDGDRAYDKRVRRWGDAFHRAVKMLTPPSTDEIEWLRRCIKGDGCAAVNGTPDPPWVMRVGLERALDALAREPELEERIVRLEGGAALDDVRADAVRVIHSQRIAELEARERRIRDAIRNVRGTMSAMQAIERIDRIFAGKDMP